MTGFVKFTAESAQQSKTIAELLERRAEKLEELAGIDSKLDEMGVQFADTGPSVTVGATAAPAKRRAAPATRPAPDGSGGRQPSLESVLLGLVEASKNGLSMEEMVDKALKSGYKSNSQDFSNMVQQAVHRMMKKKVLTRNDDSMRYFKAAAA
jgi:hypothetical protein